MFFRLKLLSLLAVIGGAFVDPAIAAPAPSAFSLDDFLNDLSTPTYVNYCRNSKANNYGDCVGQEFELGKCQEVAPGWVKGFDSFDCPDDWRGCTLYTGAGCTGSSTKVKNLYSYADLGSFANTVSSFECDRFS